MKSNDIIIEQSKLLGSLLEFTQIFYKLRTGRFFEISKPSGRESHHITICKALTRVFNGEINKLIINVPPRYSKTELLIHFVACGLGLYPDSNFIYTSYAHSLAAKQTQTVREIMLMSHYIKIIGTRLKEDTQAKDNFETTAGGSVYAVGAGGTITGRGAGVQGVKRFSGAFIMDDMHKPDEVTSDNVREGVIDWFFNTAMSRVNGPHVPFIFIGQRLHEGDLPSRLIATGEWELLSIPALDEAGNALHPTMHDRAALLKMEKENPYVFASQYQQNPQPAGGGIFRPEWFYLMDEDPEMIVTFITGDTAETSKDYNDPSVFGFWGIYKIKETDQYGLHLIDLIEVRVEPKDLEETFMAFYVDCLRYKVKPKAAAIEKKSTGVTLSSILQKIRGLRIIQIERTKASGNKTARFLEIQPFVAAKLVSLTKGSHHVEMYLEHMRRITANDSHLHDDIADVTYDAIKLGLIDKYLISNMKDETNPKKAQNIMQSQKEAMRLRANRYQAK